MYTGLREEPIVLIVKEKLDENELKECLDELDYYLDYKDYPADVADGTEELVNTGLFIGRDPYEPDLPIGYFMGWVGLDDDFYVRKEQEQGIKDFLKELVKDNYINTYFH